MFGQRDILLPVRLYDQFATTAARRRLAGATVECYWRWIEAFLRFARDGDRWVPPRDLNERHVEAFLNHLARRRDVSASTQNQALWGHLFFPPAALGWAGWNDGWRIAHLAA